MGRPKRTCQSQIVTEESKPLLRQEKKKGSYNGHLLDKLKSDEEKRASFRLQERERLRLYRRTLSDEKKAKAREKARLRAMEYRKRKEQMGETEPKKHKNIGEKDLAIRREKNRLAQRKRRANMDPEKKNQERERNLAYMHSKKRKQKVKDVDNACKTDLTASLQITPDQLTNTYHGQVINMKEEPQPIVSQEEKKQSSDGRSCLAELSSDKEKYASFRSQERQRVKQCRRTLSNEKRAKAREKTGLRAIKYRKHQEEMKENKHNNKDGRGNIQGAVILNPALKDLSMSTCQGLCIKGEPQQIPSKARKRQTSQRAMTKRPKIKNCKCGNAKNRLAQRRKRTNMDPEKNKLEEECNFTYEYEYECAQRQQMFEIYVDIACDPDPNLLLLAQTTGASSIALDTCGPIGNTVASDQPQGTHQQLVSFTKEEPQPVLGKKEKRQLYNDRFRAKLKLDDKRYASFKLKDREKKRQYRRTLSEEKKAKVREKARLRATAYRKRQKLMGENEPKKHKNINEKDLAISREKNRLAQRKRGANMDPDKKNQERERSLAYMHSKKRKQKVKDVDNACKNYLTTSLQITPDQPQGTHQQQILFIKEEPQPVLGKTEKRQLYKHRFLTKLKLDEKRYASFKLKDREKKRRYRRTLSEEKKAKAREKARLRAIAYRGDHVLN